MALALARSRQPPRSTRPSPSALTIRNVVVAGRRTSVRLEPSMWDGLRDIACRRDMTLNDLVTEIDRYRGTPGLTAAIRIYIVNFYRNASGMGVHPDPVRPPI
jgi:predicted DNA-binding ribbon-helix-helix protein